MGINDWPERERPRERLLKDGPSALSDAELLAIFLRVGIKGKSAVDLARELIQQFEGNLATLTAAPPSVLSSLPGMGPAKTAQLLASVELAKRSLIGQLTQKDVFGSPVAVRQWLQFQLAGRQHEIFLALWLDSGNQLIAAEELFRGTLTQTSIYPREVVKSALAHNAASVIVAHNHPSGRITPSDSDITLTKSLKEALAMIDVRLLDHFVVAPGTTAQSLAELGLI